MKKEIKKEKKYKRIIEWALNIQREWARLRTRSKYRGIQHFLYYGQWSRVYARSHNTFRNCYLHKEIFRCRCSSSNSSQGNGLYRQWIRLLTSTTIVFVCVFFSLLLSLNYADILRIQHLLNIFFFSFRLFFGDTFQWC